METKITVLSNTVTKVKISNSTTPVGDSCADVIVAPERAPLGRARALGGIPFPTRSKVPLRAYYVSRASIDPFLSV